ERLHDRLRRARAGRGEDDGGERLRRDLGPGEHTLQRLAEDAAVAVPGLERARDALRKLLLPRPPCAQELVRDRMRGDHLGPPCSSRASAALTASVRLSSSWLATAFSPPADRRPHSLAISSRGRR